MVVSQDTPKTSRSEGRKPDREIACGITRTPHATKTLKILQNIRIFCWMMKVAEDFSKWIGGGRLSSVSRKFEELLGSLADVGLVFIWICLKASDWACLG